MTRDLASISNDPDAFEAFYRAHVEAVQRFVARRVADRDRAADLTADIFVAAVESAAGYRPARGTPVAWLFGVARLVVASDHRRRGREREGLSRIAGHRLLDEEDAARIDARIDAEAQARVLYRAMDRLPDGQRAVLELTALDGLALGEAAAALGISPVAARVRLHRARHVLREQVADPEADGLRTTALSIEVPR